MIVRFKVKNFRSLRDEVCLDFRATESDAYREYYVQEYPELNLNLLKMTMIYGKNASGKTNILRAIEFLRNFILNKSADKDKPTGITPFELDKDKDTYFEIEYVYEDMVYRYELCLNSRMVVSERLSHCLGEKFESIFYRESVGYNKEITYCFDWSGSEANESLIGNLELTIPTQSILTRLKEYHYSGPMQQAYNWFKDIMAPIVMPQTDLLKWNVENFLSSTDKNNFKDFYVKQLQNADFIVSDIEVERKEVPFDEHPDAKILKILAKEMERDLPKQLQSMDIFLHHTVSDGNYKLNISDQSEGTIRFLELCGFLCWVQREKKTVCIDEIERSMHEDLIKHFLATYLNSAKESQLIFTSQNISILNMIDLIRHDAIWITDRKNNGGTELFRITDYDIDESQYIGDMYRLGLIGGSPNIGGIIRGMDDEC